MTTAQTLCTAIACSSMEDGAKLSIYKVVRNIKRRDNTLYNALRSIYEDSIFIGEISQLWPELPLLANLRCGLWYSPKFHSNCYFKSTDGHNNNWSFNTSRLNLHVALLAGQKGGCIIVDSTRRGKRFPDSMSKTIPIWTCVLNRSISKHLNKIHGSSLELGEPSTSNVFAENGRKPAVDWDCSLHLPLWISGTEKAAIEERLEEWTKQLDDSGADVATLASILKKPLRPLWISQRSVIWLNEVPDHDSWDFTPIILVSGSFSTGVVQQRTTTEFSWNYIAGAGDDEESWARGLSPNLFWNHAHDLMSSGPDVCNQKVAEIVEKNRVYRALRGNDAPQISVKSQKLGGSSTQVPPIEQMLSLDISDAKLDTKSSDGHCSLSWLGSTNLAVGSSLHVVTASDIDCILNCDQESVSVCLPISRAYLHLPTVMSKLDRFSLSRNLSSAVDFAKLNLSQGKRLLVCCSNGEDISICVCLAILTSLFDDKGTFDCGKSFNETRITKLEMRKRLVYICKFATNARPSRGNLRQVFNFLSVGKTDPVSRSP